MEDSRRCASLSFDLDNKWSYLKTHGDPGWSTFPSYLDTVVPRTLEFLEGRRQRITFFVVGQDAALPQNEAPIQRIAAAGHEIGNHSFHHDPWLHLYSEAEIDQDLARAEEHLERVTGRRPVGFRGPGFSLSRPALAVLARRGYLYDASTLPTFIGPIGRAYFMWSSKLSPEERERRKALFGSVRDALRPNTPYRWQMHGHNLLEIPVTTMPFLRVPIHVSYVLYLSSFSRTAALAYFRTAIELCRAMGVGPSILLHPLDFMGRDDTRDLDFFPAMNMRSGEKIEVVHEVLEMLSRAFRTVTMREHVEEINRREGLQLLEPIFAP